jgi:hypothetical protein
MSIKVAKSSHYVIRTLDGNGLAIYIGEDDQLYVKDHNGSIQLLKELIGSLSIEIPLMSLQSGSSGTSGKTNGTSGSSGISGSNGQDGTSGENGIDGSSGSSGSSGNAGTSGMDGTSGSSGLSGFDGASGSSGSSGSSGINGIDGSSGTSGNGGTNGTSGINGTSGSSGKDGDVGTEGSNGTSGSSGVCGSSGTSGKGYSFEEIQSGSKTLLDFRKSQILYLNLNNNTTLNFADFPVGIFYLIVKQGIGNYSVTFPYVVKQSKGFEYVPSIFPNAVDVLQFMCDGTSYYVIDCKKEY